MCVCGCTYGTAAVPSAWMEELKCFLLGFGASSLAKQPQRETAERGGEHSSLSPSPPSSPTASLKRRRNPSATVHEDPADDHSSPSASATAWMSPALRARLHPAEVHLLSQLLPLGEHYTVLSAAAQDTAVGRTEGLYPSAVGSAIGRILPLYTDDVRRAATPSAMASLRETYGVTFRALVHMVRLSQRQREEGKGEEGSLAIGGREKEEEPSSQQDTQREGLPHGATAALVAAIQSFVLNKEAPLSFRQIVGVCLWRSVLYTTAHYVAHGVVLHGRRDYFISVAPGTAERPAEQHTLHTDMLPSGVSVDLGMLILTAGKERRVLLTESDTHGGNHLEQLALGIKDTAAEAVFKAVFNLSLCEGGVLAADELTARVEAARALWSKALWLKVGSTSSLAENLEALQVIFLCTRGDVWLAFVERCFDALSGVDSSGASLTSRDGFMIPLRSDRAAAAIAAVAAVASSGGGGGRSRTGVFTQAAAQRAVTEAFTYALSVSDLAEKPVYGNYRVYMAAPHSSNEEEELYGASASRSVEATAQLWIDRVRSIGVRFSAPQGLQLVVSAKAMGYYQRLFSEHIGMRFATYTMHLTRQLFVGAIVTNKNPSSDLRRAYRLFQLLCFLLTTVGRYLQVDGIAMPSAELQQHIHQCRSVDEAKRRHDRFIWRVAEGSFLVEGSEALHAACRALYECAVTLFVVCTRYRLNYWAVEGVNRTPVEVAAALAALEVRVQQRVVAAFTEHLATSSRPAERALWVRMDFNRFFTPRRARSSGAGMGIGSFSLSSSLSPTAAAKRKAVNEPSTTGFAQPRQQLSLPAAAPTATMTTTSPVQVHSQQLQRTRGTHSRRRASSTGPTLRAKQANTSLDHEEEGSQEEQQQGSPSHETSAEGRTLISSVANRYRKPEK